ncbi:MAG: hypothetical protein JSV04_12465 [Candidatus Heimdallarchaeota archaeon]|nr:MAG: hypothetical protein JSV04_12465 [Candidatus Heimdallarchaeota archaeon]
METTDIIASILVGLALVMAILSTIIRTALNDFFEDMGVGMVVYWLPGDILLFLIEAGLFILVIATAIYGQRISRT